MKRLVYILLVLLIISITCNVRLWKEYKNAVTNLNMYAEMYWGTAVRLSELEMEMMIEEDGFRSPMDIAKELEENK